MIIAIGHESEVGKDTFCSFVIDHIRKQNMKHLAIEREGFADRLYDLCYSLYSWAGFQKRQYYIANPKAKGVVLPKLGKCPRELLIGHGNKCREFDPRCWLDAVIQNRDPHLKIIPDLRKVNEFEHCENEGVFRLRIRIPGRPKSKWESDVDLYPIEDSRWSETIENDAGLEQLRNKAVDFADRIIVPTLFKYRSGECKPQDFKFSK